MLSKTAIATLAMTVAALCVGQSIAQTVSRSHQGAGGRGVSYNRVTTPTSTGSQTTASLQTNGGYGGTATHTTNTASGSYRGATTVNTNNGTSASAATVSHNGTYYTAGTVTGPDGQTVSGGAVYTPH